MDVYEPLETPVDSTELDTKAPKRVELPFGAVGLRRRMEPSDDQDAPPASPPPSEQPPVLALLLNDSLPRSPPPPGTAAAMSLDARTPQKVELPHGALGGSPRREPAADEDPIALGRMPRSPPPAQPPMVSIRLSASLPPSPPSSVPGATPQALLLEMLTPGQAPPMPTFFPDASEQAMAEAEMMQWCFPGAEFAQFPMDAEFAQFSQEGVDFVNFAMGMPIPSGLPSRGSILHGTGKCRPCAWFWKSSGCQNKEDCGHCHLCPDGEIKARKKAKQNVARLGLATPSGQPEESPECQMGFFFSEPEVSSSPLTTTCSVSEQEWTGISNSGSGSEEELTTAPEVDCDTAASLDFPPGLTQPAGAGEAPATPGPSPRTAFSASPGGSPSAGSAAHGSGACRPCAWFWKPVGCQNDAGCTYCHLCPESELKQRKKCKQTMLRLGLTPAKGASASDDMQEAKYALSLASLI